jgi:hypothetical protein
LKSKFNTVCFTEAPLHQVKYLIKNLPGRKIKLKPYGLVFWKHQLEDNGANSAIYINAKGTQLDTFLLKQFKDQFKHIKSYSRLSKNENFFNEIINYYSLINVVKDSHDFMWEREWRLNRDFKFNYSEVVAIIAENPTFFLKHIKKNVSDSEFKYISRIPIICPEWGYEEVIEELSCALWEKS